ncbi:MAG: 2-isopropylmalate synthase [Pseudomonadota bacterium]
MTESEAQRDDNRLIIFDTTLRDGEQAPGCSMTLNEKLTVGTALAALGVDVIEAGFPAASPGDFEAVQAISETLKGPVIAGLCRSNRADIEKAHAALRNAERKRLHVFLATSAIHREFKLKMAKEEILRRVEENVRFARSLCEDVEFSPEDASRTELPFLADVVRVALEAGATTINVPDTVGYTAPSEFYKLFRYLKENIEGIDAATLSVHCHNDLGLAVSNSLAAVQAGARQIECTINGIGERAGNCALEEIVMAVRTRNDILPYTTGIDTTRLHATSRLVEQATGLHVQRNKAIVGANAFAHEAGIHQHGMLENAETYEIMRPQDVGISRTQLVLGKHSGRHAFRQRVEEMGYELNETEFEDAFEAFKVLADRKKDIYDADIEAIILRAETATPGPWEMVSLTTQSSTDAPSSAAVAVRHSDGREVTGRGEGQGPVEAVFGAIQDAVGVSVLLRQFEIRGVTLGEDAQGDVALAIEHEGGQYHGSGLSTDVVEASARAFIQAVNRASRGGAAAAEDAGEADTVALKAIESVSA